MFKDLGIFGVYGLYTSFTNLFGYFINIKINLYNFPTLGKSHNITTHEEAKT